MAALRDKFDAYFATLNPTSSRMMADLSAVRQKSEWNNLTEDERTRIVWKCLVGTDAENKYAAATSALESNTSFPVLDIKPGEKIVIDEDTSNGRPFGCSWRDEHSSPFSWETKSQLNLHLLDGDLPKVPPKVPPRVSSRPDRAKPSTPVASPGVPPPAPPVMAPVLHSSAVPPPPPPTSFLHSPAASHVITAHGKALAKDHKPMKVIQKPTNPPPCPPIRSSSIKPNVESASDLHLSRATAVRELPVDEEQIPVSEGTSKMSQCLGSQSSLESPTKSIPKTGFDFLDNW